MPVILSKLLANPTGEILPQG